MKKPLVWQMKILATKSKKTYLEQMEKMHEKRARQLKGKELDIRIKEMHAHMRGSKLKEG
jgi:hypothetical protein